MHAAGHQDMGHLTIGPHATIRAAMVCIDRNELKIALTVDSEGRLLGTVSDGDVRRALLDGASLDDAVSSVVNRHPVTVPPSADRAGVLDIMRARDLSQIPVVGPDGRLVGLHVLHELLGSTPKDNHAVILAGGRGSRLGHLTSTVPKSMLPVAGRPILERLVLHLVGSGIRHVHLSVGYLAEQIADHFGDGSDFGCTIEYLIESPERPLGTGGPLRLLRDRAIANDAPLLVLNGDLVASFSVGGILDTHARTDAVMTVALRDYSHEVPFGVATMDASNPDLLSDLAEKPRWSGRVNAGIYVIEPRLLSEVPGGVSYPITDLVLTCLDRGERVAGWEYTDEWHDVGRPFELARARGEI